MSQENEQVWPLTFREVNAFNEPQLRIEHIASWPGGYCYPPGDRRRYTAEGWEIWQKINAEAT